MCRCILCAGALLISSCSLTKRYEKHVLSYLETKYDGEEFELLSYTKNKKRAADTK